MLLRLQIYGRVQGVYYRKSTQEYARSLGLVGWVRNRPDGSVELCALDPKSPRKDSPTYSQLHDWCHEGPINASVTRVDENWIEKMEDWSDFVIDRTFQTTTIGEAK